MFHDMKVVSGDKIQESIYQSWWSGVMELGAPPWEEVPSEYKDNTKQVIDWLKKEKGIPIFSQLRDTILYGRPPEKAPSDVTVEVWHGNARDFLDGLVNDACTFKRRRQLVPLLLKIGATILTLINKEGVVFGSIICTSELDGKAIVVMSTTEGRQRTAVLLTSALGWDGWLTREVVADYVIEELGGVEELNDPFIIHAPGVEVDGIVEREVPPGLTNETSGKANKFCEGCGHRVRRLSCMPGDRHPIVCRECGGEQVRISSDEEEHVRDRSPGDQGVWFAYLLDHMSPHTQGLVERETRRVTDNPSEYVGFRAGSSARRNLSGHQINVAALIMHGDRGNDTEHLLGILHSRQLDENNIHALVWWAYMCLKWSGQYSLPCPTNSLHTESFAEALCPMLGIEYDGERWVTSDGRTARRCSMLVAEELVDRGCFPIQPGDFIDWASLGL